MTEQDLVEMWWPATESHTAPRLRRVRREPQAAVAHFAPGARRSVGGPPKKPLGQNAMRVLDALSDVPQMPREIRKRVPLNRSAMANALHRLSERDLAIRSGGGWRLTRDESPGSSATIRGKRQGGG